MRKLLIPFLMLSLFALGACPGGGVPGVPDAPKTPKTPTAPGGKQEASDVDPNTCGNYAASDAGKKIKAFLQATLALNKSVLEAEAEMKVSCGAMAAELGVSEEGDTATVCNAVSEAIKEHLSVGLKAGAALTLKYEPAVCTVNASAAASAAASCEGKASADVSATCQGTCNGTCDGTCAGTNKGGKCNGQCQGTCQGECSGAAEVDASAECKTSAEVNASVEATCTEPKLEVTFKAKMVADAPKVEKVKKALMKGMPKLLKLQAYVKVPLMSAFVTWSKSAKSLAASGAKLYGSMGDQAACIGGQLAGALAMVGAVKSSLDVQVEVSVSVSASASAEGSAGK